MYLCVCVVCVHVIHCLSLSGCWVLSSDVALNAGGRFESHGAAGAFMEHVTMSLLDVRLHRVQASKHHQATGTSAEREREMWRQVKQRNMVAMTTVQLKKASHLYPMRRAKCKQVSSRCVWNCGCLAVPPHSGHTCGGRLWWMRWWAAALQLFGRSMGGEQSVHGCGGGRDGKFRPKAGVKLELILIHDETTGETQTQKTHSCVCCFDFLKVLSNLFFAAELNQALRTFITEVLHFFCFLVWFSLVWLRCWVRGDWP